MPIFWNNIYNNTLLIFKKRQNRSEIGWEFTRAISARCFVPFSAQLIRATEAQHDTYGLFSPRDDPRAAARHNTYPNRCGRAVRLGSLPWRWMPNGQKIKTAGKTVSYPIPA